MKLTRLILALLLTLFTGSMATAAPVGTLILENGKVRIRSMNIDNTYTEAGARIRVNSGDEIQTAADSRAVISLDANGDDIELYSKTFFRLTDVTPARQELSLPIGKVHFSVKKVRTFKERKRFRIRTANAIIGVKGTEGIGQTDGVSTDVACTEGTCTISSPERPDVAVEVQANQVSRVRGARLPTRPVAVPPKVIAAFKAAATGKRVQGIRFGATVKVPPKTGEKKEGKKGEGQKTGQQPAQGGPVAGKPAGPAPGAAGPAGGTAGGDDTGQSPAEPPAGEGDGTEGAEPGAGDPGLDDPGAGDDLGLDDEPGDGEVDIDEIVEETEGVVEEVTDDLDEATETSATIRLEIVN